MDLFSIIAIIVGLAVGVGGGFFMRGDINKKKEKEFEKMHDEKMQEAKKELHEIKKRIEQSEKKAGELVSNAQRSASSIVNEAKQEEKELRQKIEKQEERLIKKESIIDQKIDSLEKKIENIKKQEDELNSEKEKISNQIENQKAELEKIAKFSQEQAKEHLLHLVEKDSTPILVKRYQQIEEEIKEQADDKAKNIVVHSIQKLATDVTASATVTVVPIPSDDMKGRIIGKEGRNINSFEQLTGVDVIVDDTPGSVLISGFDLVRRYIAKRALEALIEDGRIHPAHIEESVEKARKEVSQMIKEFGEKAVFEVGVTGLHPDVIKLLGRLRFRTSYGQNILKHSMEVSYLAAAIAGQVGANVNVAKKAGLLHDIGKAVTHEIEGPHAVIGADILRKYKVDEATIHAVEAHHEDIPLQSIEDFVVQAADMISGARPGARSGSADKFIKRMKELEETATSFVGVNKAYAIQAGREVRVMVDPEEMNDAQMMKLANDIAHKMEKELVYPGRIKVNVIRETRATSFAS